MAHLEPAQDAPALSWEALHALLHVAKYGSYRAAERRSGISASQLRRRIEHLELQVGAKLLVANYGGVRATPEGNRILAAARSMEWALLGVVRRPDRAPMPMEGIVRIATTEALATFWLTPLLGEFQRNYPRLQIELQSSMQAADVLRLDADVAVLLNPPTAPDLILRKIARLHSMPAAAPSYLDTYGIPSSLEELREHRIVGQFAEQTRTREAFDAMFPQHLQEHVVYRTNNSSSLLWAIVKGLGIGWSPTYMHFLGPKFVSLDLNLVYEHDVWLTYHRAAAEVERVRRVIDWLKAAFDPSRYPWFRDDFIHPRDLARIYKGPLLPNSFEGLTWGTEEQVQRYPTSVGGQVQ